MNIGYIYGKLSSDRKEILRGALGSDIVRSFFSDIAEEEKRILFSLDTDCSSEEFKQKYLAVKKSIAALEDLMRLIDTLKKQNGEIK